MLNTVLEVAGFLLVVLFCVVVWWPSALLVGGVGLLLKVNWEPFDVPRRPAKTERA